MIPRVTRIFSHFIHKVDGPLLRLSNGWVSSGSILAGWPIVYVTMIGAKTGLPRSLPLIGLPDGERFALIASNLGQTHNPAWYYNLIKNPECAALFRGQTRQYLARPAEPEERERYWKLGVSYYEGYESYKAWAGNRMIPIIVLEPKR
jgi:deazaflavin-dependent oxidoreductase (nitroreductase family)